MEPHTIKPAQRPQAAAVGNPPIKHALYAWRSESLYEDNGTEFRGICYSDNPNPMPGWIKVGPVGCLFERGTVIQPPALPNGLTPLGVPTRPLVQFARRVTVGVAYSLELAPAAEGTPAYNEWLNRRKGRFSGPGVVLGYVLPPTDSQPFQLTRPLYSAQVRGNDGLPLNQSITTDLATWMNLVEQAPTAYGLENSAVDDVTPLAQITPIFEVEINVVAGVIVPSVTVGTVGAEMGDIEIPAGPGSLIRFTRRFDATFSVDEIVVKDSTGNVAAGFDAIVNTDATVLLSNTADAGLYEYTIFVTLEATGEGLRLDPKIRNRSGG